MIQNADFIVPVEIEGTVHNVYVIKRPGVDAFMQRMGEIYEVVVFTASLSKVSCSLVWRCLVAKALSDFFLCDSRSPFHLVRGPGAGHSGHSPGGPTPSVS